MCGIPRIELHGTEDDWRWIRDKLAGMRQFGMERRIQALVPVLNECVAAAEGRANTAIWKSYYKYASESGSSYVSGWINVFFVGEEDKLLDAVLAPGFSWAAAEMETTSLGAVNLPLALATRSYTIKGVVDVDFIWRYFDQTIPMRWRAGFMGVAQDEESMTLKPVIAWQVLRAKLSSEECIAAEYLSGVKKLDFWTMETIRHGFALDPKFGCIRDVRPRHGGPLDAPFWKRALPMMVRMEQMDASELIDMQTKAEQIAILEAMLSAPAVKRVLIPSHLDEECLRILQERKDWTIHVKKSVLPGQEE